MNNGLVYFDIWHGRYPAGVIVAEFIPGASMALFPDNNITQIYRENPLLSPSWKT